MMSSMLAFFSSLASSSSLSCYKCSNANGEDLLTAAVIAIAATTAAIIATAPTAAKGCAQRRPRLKQNLRTAMCDRYNYHDLAATREMNAVTNDN